MQAKPVRKADAAAGRASLTTTLKAVIGLASYRDRVRFAAILAVLLSKGALEMVAVGAVPAYIAVALKPDIILGHPTLGTWLGEMGIGDATTLLYAGTAALVVYYSFLALFGLATTYVESRYLFGFHVRLAQRLFAAYMFAPWSFHLKNNSAALIRNVVYEVELATHGFGSSLFTLLRAGITGLAITTFLLFMEPLLTLIVLIVLGLVGGATVLGFRTRLGETGQRTVGLRKTQMQTMSQGLSLLKEVRILGREGAFVERLSGAIGELAKARRFEQIVAVVPTQVMELLAIFLVILIASLLAWRGEDNETIAIILGMFGIGLVQLRRIVAQLASSVNGMRFRAGSVLAIAEDLDRLAAHRSITQRPQPPLADGSEIRLHQLSVRYPDTEAPAIQDIDLTIRHPSTIGIVGHTGAGKTTLVDALLGLVPATSGSITVDGQPLDPTQSDWQRRFAYVPQTITLIDDTIRRNVALGLPDDKIDETRLNEALAAAHALEFVDRLPEGLDTMVGERGVRLSGGQRQRLGIARALYGNPAILVLDEGTSALDSVTEEIVVEALKELRGRCSILLITHRDAMLANCDAVVELEGGRTVNKMQEARIAPIAG